MSIAEVPVRPGEAKKRKEHLPPMKDLWNLNWEVVIATVDYKSDEELSELIIEIDDKSEEIRLRTGIAQLTRQRALEVERTGIVARISAIASSLFGPDTNTLDEQHLNEYLQHLKALKLRIREVMHGREISPAIHKEVNRGLGLEGDRRLDEETRWPEEIRLLRVYIHRLLNERDVE